MTVRLYLILLFILTAGFGFSQSNPIVKDTGTGILEYKHPREAMEGNFVHDKMLYLRINSDDVSLPEHVIQSLVVIKDPEDLVDKYRYQREVMLRILYNPRVSKADKIFVQNYVKESGEEPLTDLIPFFNDYFTQNP